MFVYVESMLEHTSYWNTVQQRQTVW